jgi:serine/threonine protein kinase
MLGIPFIYFVNLLTTLGMTWLEQVMAFYFGQIWSFIRSMVFGNLGPSGKELKPILVTMRKIENIVVDVDQIQLNKQLCNYLGKKIVKTRITLEAFVSMSTSITIDQKRAFQEIHMLVKHAEVLVQKCKEFSWLDGAITLANVEEDVIEILLGLSWWTRVLKMTSADMEEFKVLQNTTKALRKQEKLLQKFLNANSSLQGRAKDDKDYLLAKLADVKGQHAHASTYNKEQILSIYLLARIMGDAENVINEVDTQLKEYTKVKSLGKGGSGVVNEVTWLEKKCALKIINASNSNMEEKEVTILRSCHHPHIAQFFWYWKHDRKSYIMMEWMPKDLFTHIEHKVQGGSHTPFKLHVAIDIMLQVANAMRYLHNRNIVHRDLKTLNILVQPNMEFSQGYLHVKLADFGVAKTYNMTETFSTQTPGQGTPTYAAPEVNFGQPVVHGEKSPKFPPKADVWSFAMVCSEILTGEPPFASEPRATLHAKIIDHDLRPPLPNDCPSYLRHCISSCWELSPVKRPNFSTVCTNLMLAKTMSLGIIPIDICNDRFLKSKKIQKRLDVGATLPVESPILFPKPFQSPNRHEMEVHEQNGQGYYLIGTYFTYYTNVSKNKEIVGQAINYKTGIYNKGLKTLEEVNAIKFLFQPHEITIMEGSCWLEHINGIAYGCLTGLFVDSQHLKRLKEKEIEVVQGGFTGETDVRIRITPEIKRFSWGTMNSIIATGGELAASFYGQGFRYVYFYLEYGCNKPTLISHLWHGDDLVFGNKENIALTSRNVLGNQILETHYYSKYITFTLSIS